ncbi:MAG: amidotransferase [Candidatus Eisenbacteria bacterium]
MRVRALQHVPHEGPAAVAAWAADRGHSLQVTRLDWGEPLPAVADFDLLVVMGGPMSANDEALHPWIVEEKRLIGETIQADRRLLGICLGAQMIAAALGKRIYAAPAPEIGWLAVRVTAGAARSRTFAGMPATITPLHWHGETFDLPEGAIRLAETDLCPNQAFEIEFDGGPERGGALALALQFHLEATEESVRAMVAAENPCATGAGGAGALPPEKALLASPAHYAAIHPFLHAALDALVTRPAAR